MKPTDLLMLQAELFWDRRDVLDDLNITGLDGWMETAANLMNKLNGTSETTVNSLEYSYTEGNNGNNMKVGIL